MFLATYSIMSSGISTPSRYNLFLSIETLVSKSGVCNSAERPHLNEIISVAQYLAYQQALCHWLK